LHTEGERRKKGRERGREDRRKEKARGRCAPEAEHGLSVMYCGVAGRTVLVCLQVFYYACLADCGVTGEEREGW